MEPAEASGLGPERMDATARLSHAPSWRWAIGDPVAKFFSTLVPAQESGLGFMQGSGFGFRFALGFGLG